MGKSLKVSNRRRRLAEAPEANGSWSDLDYHVGADADLSGMDLSSLYAGSDSMLAMLGERERHLMDLMSLPDTCLLRNILHVWNYDVDRIRTLDQAQIIADVNSALIEGFVFFRPLHSITCTGTARICCLTSLPPINGSFSMKRRRNYTETESLMFLLSDIERDVNDNVIRVGATMMTWLLDNTESVN